MDKEKFAEKISDIATELGCLREFVECLSFACAFGLPEANGGSKNINGALKITSEEMCRIENGLCSLETTIRRS